MALVKCSECKAEISDKAASCPKCGAPIETPVKKKNPIGYLTIFLIVIGGLFWLYIVVGVFSSDSTKSKLKAIGTATVTKPKPTLTNAQKESIKREKERVEKWGPKPINSGWDGSVREVKDYLKSVAKDPDSLKYESWSDVAYSEKDGWLVLCKYRGKNSFGGYAVNANWFVIRNRQVVDVKPHDTYQPE